jgi:hypothetical protein
VRITQPIKSSEHGIIRRCQADDSSVRADEFGELFDEGVEMTLRLGVG